MNLYPHSNYYSFYLFLYFRARVVKQISGSRTCPSNVACGSGNNQPSSTSGSAADTGDSNTFISYVLNHQRGSSGSGIFVLDASRGLSTPHQVQDGNPTHEAQAQSVSVRYVHFLIKMELCLSYTVICYLFGFRIISLHQSYFSNICISGHLVSPYLIQEVFRGPQSQVKVTLYHAPVKPSLQCLKFGMPL